MERPDNLPPHGTRKRYREFKCRCMACAYGPHTGKGKGPIPDELRWPYHFLERHFTKDFVEAWYKDDEIASWKETGLEDFEADRVCLLLGDFPSNVFPGYIQAGIDSGFYP